jgi:hypothetical protein
MRGSKNRAVLNVESMEAKVLLSTIAPAAAIRAAAAPAVAIEHVGAMPMVRPGNNVITIVNSTSYKIKIFAEIDDDKKDKTIESKGTDRFDFDNKFKNAIVVTKIESEGIGPGPLATRVKLTPNKFSAFYLNATYTVSLNTSTNKFQVGPGTPI